MRIVISILIVVFLGALMLAVESMHSWLISWSFAIHADSYTLADFAVSRVEYRRVHRDREYIATGEVNGSSLMLDLELLAVRLSSNEGELQEQFPLGSTIEVWVHEAPQARLGRTLQPNLLPAAVFRKPGWSDAIIRSIAYLAPAFVTGTALVVGVSAYRRRLKDPATQAGAFEDSAESDWDGVDESD